MITKLKRCDRSRWLNILEKEADDAREVNHDDGKANTRRCRKKRSRQTEPNFEVDEDVDLQNRKPTNAGTTLQRNLNRGSEEIFPSVRDCERPQQKSARAQRNPTSPSPDVHWADSTTGNRPLKVDDVPEQAWKIIERVSQGNHNLSQDILDNDTSNPLRQHSRPYRALPLHHPFTTPHSSLHAFWPLRITRARVPKSGY